MDDIELKKITDDLGKTFEAFKDAHEAELKELKKGFADVVTADKLKRVDDALNALQEKKDAADRAAAARMDELEKRLNRPGAGDGGDKGEAAAALKAFNLERKSFFTSRGQSAPADVEAEAYGEYKSAFAAALRKGNMHLLPAEQQKALQVGVDSDGGYLVPADMSGRIVSKIYELSPVRSIFGNVTISTDRIEGIEDLDQAGAIQWVAETEAPTETTTPTIGKWQISVHTAAAEPKLTQQILDDAAIDVEGWLANKIADRFARGEAAVFLTGNGVSKPRGLTDYTTAATADGSRSWGQFEHVATGQNGAFASSNPADNLFDLIGAFKDAYLQNARWLTRREVITLVRKFKESTTNAYMWQPGLQQGQPQQLLGFPVTIAQDMPTLATGSLSLAFGDFREAYTIVDRIGMRVLRDNLTAKPYVKFYTTKRVGGGALNFEAVKFIKFGS